MPKDNAAETGADKQIEEFVSLVTLDQRSSKSEQNSDSSVRTTSSRAATVVESPQSPRPPPIEPLQTPPAQPVELLQTPPVQPVAVFQPAERVLSPSKMALPSIPDIIAVPGEAGSVADMDTDVSDERRSVAEHSVSVKSAPRASDNTGTVLLNDIIREMHKDVVHSDFGEKITIIYDIDREIGRLSKLKVSHATLEKPNESMSINMLQQLLLRYKSIRLNSGVEEFSRDTHIAGAVALEKIFNGKRRIFGTTPCLKGLSGRIGGLMTNTNIDSSAIFKRVLRAIGMFNDEGLTALGIVNAVCITLADNGINTERDVKGISR